jgi:hypothetical protein
LPTRDSWLKAWPQRATIVPMAMLERRMLGWCGGKAIKRLKGSRLISRTWNLARDVAYIPGRSRHKPNHRGDWFEMDQMIDLESGSTHWCWWFPRSKAGGDPRTINDLVTPYRLRYIARGAETNFWMCL